MPSEEWPLAMSFPRTARRSPARHGFGQRRRLMAFLSVGAVLLAATIVVPPAGATPSTTAVRAQASVQNSLTSIDDTDPAVTYSGEWQTGPGAAKFGGSDHYTDHQGASASLSFTGNSISLFGAQAPWHGDLSVSVDGGAAVAVSVYAAGRADDVQLFQRNDLSDGPHTITVTAMGTGARGHVIAVDRFQIGSDQSAPAATTPPPASSTAVDDVDAAFAYSGPWQTSQGPAKSAGDDHYSDSSGATATLTFDGTGATVLGAMASWYGIATFSVDGGPETQVDLYSAERLDQQSLFSVHGLAAGSHTIRATVTGRPDATSSGTVISIDGAQVDGTADTSSSSTATTTPSLTTVTILPSTPAQTTPAQTTPTTPPTPAAGSAGFVTRSGSRLQLDGSTFRFAGANEYWLGLDDNIKDAAGQPTHPTQSRIDSGLNAAAAAGLTVIRSHSMGISVGCAACVEPSLGVFDDTALASADYAMYRAGQLGLKMIIPLTDQWRYYHGGISTFTAWRGYPNDPDTSVTAATSDTERDAEMNFYSDPKVVGDFEAYIAHLLDHVNPYTGLAWKNDPTVMAWETGNELWTANPTWTEQIASFIKNTLGARQLVADGSGADRMRVINAAIDAPDVDMVSGHFYPVDVAWMAVDAAVAAAHQKVYFVGEYAWTDLGASTLLMAAAHATPHVSGDLVWSILPYQEDGTPEPHADGYALYSPATNGPMKLFLDILSAHAQAMKRG